MSDQTASIVRRDEAEATTDRRSVGARCNLGWAHYGERHYDQAVMVFREALELDAASVDALYGLALSLKEAGQHEEAIPVFARVMKLAPQKEPGARGRMLARLARGHINQIKKGDWDLGDEMRYEEST